MTEKLDLTWEPNVNDKYIVGCDPALIPNWWQKILIWFRLKKDPRKSKGYTTIFKVSNGVTEVVTPGDNLQWMEDFQRENYIKNLPKN